MNFWNRKLQEWTCTTTVECYKNRHLFRDCPPPAVFLFPCRKLVYIVFPINRLFVFLSASLFNCSLPVISTIIIVQVSLIASLPPCVKVPTISCGTVMQIFVFLMTLIQSTCLLFTFRGFPAPPQLLHSDVLVFTVQVAVFVGLLLLHIFYYELGKERERQVSFNRFSESSWWMYL